MLRALAQTRALSTSVLRQKESDLITQAFLKQVRDLTQKQKAAGGTLVNTSPEIKKQLDEQLNRLAQKFKLPSADVVGKLDVQFETATVESSVGAMLEGAKTLDDLIADVKHSQESYVREREEKRKAEAAKKAALESGAAGTPAAGNLAPSAA
ncbi:ATP synthase F6 family protein [Aphelenchoides avenae]|nr:ATP synthase F6 family protein [Aphelenchus avenae]